MSYTDHVKSSHTMIIRCAVITLSDTRTIETDSSGKKIVELLQNQKHTLVDHRILKDDPNDLAPWITQLLADDQVDVILTTGGTGISRRDQTIAVVENIMEQTLPGFGELFRQLSFTQIGSGAMLSRAIAGIAKGKLIFAMPGSTAAVELAMTKLILPEIRHLVFELQK